MQKLGAFITDLLILLLALSAVIVLPVTSYVIGQFQIVQACSVYQKFDHLGMDYDCAPHVPQIETKKKGK